MTNKTLFILSLPPPFGGGEIISEILYNKLEHIDNYYFKLFSRKRHNKSSQANAYFIPVFQGIKHLFSCLFQITKLKPENIYIGLPKGFPAFVRNSILILYGKILGSEIVCELHGMNFPFEKSGWKRKYLLYILSKISKIRVLSSSIEKYFEKLDFQGKMYVIPNGIDPPDRSFYKNKNTIGPFMKFLYFGAISGSKGFFRTIEVLTLLYQKGLKNFKLNVIGEWVNPKEQNDFLHSKTYDLLKNNLVFMGKLTAEHKWAKVSACDLLIHLTDFDGMPLTIIETMALGIPTISTKVGAIPDMIVDGYNGFLVDSSEETLKVLELLLKKDISYNTLTQNAFITFNQQYTSEIMANRIIEMIED